MPRFANKRSRDESDGSDNEQAKVNKKKAKTATVSKSAAGGSGEDLFWPLSDKRRVAISDFKGGIYVNIREYYDAGQGDMRPGKKGISLNLDQYKTLLDLIPTINAALRAKGHDVGDDNDVVLAGQPSSTKDNSATKKAKKAKKSNIEATSDEEEEEDD